MYDIPVEVKKVLKKGRGLKRYRFEVYADDAASEYEFTIENDNLVVESVKIDERMCSSNVIKFGLCEGSSLEFQYFGFDNINGKTIKAFLDVQYKNEGALTWYSIPMGFFTVEQCPMQFATGIFKVTAYNKLRSKYLDNKANALINDGFVDVTSGTVKICDIRRLLLSDYEINYANERITPHHSTGGTGYLRKCGTSTTLKAKYGIDTPLSWWMMCNATYGPSPSSSIPTMYPFSVALELEINLDPDKAYTFDIYDRLDDYEQEIYDKIKDEVGKATNTSGQTFMNNMMNSYSYSYSGETIVYRGWYDFCGIILTKENDAIEIYSKISYDRHLTNVKGSFKNLSLLTIKGYKKIKINIPHRLFLIANSVGELTSGDVSYDFTLTGGANYYSYTYYTDSSLDFTETKRYYCTYPDGSKATYDSKINLVTAYDMNLTDADLIDVNPFTLAEVTLRDILNGVYELSVCYGKLDRETNIFAPVELNQGGLHPQEGLYPAIGLHPNGNTGGKAIHPFPAEYQKLWTDSVGMQNFRYLRITYKTLDSNNNETEKVLQRTVNTHGTTDYNMSSNWLFLNLIWDPEDVGDYADAMVEKMRDISWFPFEMWAAGLPYIETGDAIEITDREDNTYTSYILQRQLNGIHNLQDTFINGELDVF